MARGVVGELVQRVDNLLRAAHGDSLETARDKLFWFLCGWLGGPDHYISRFGHPRLRARHLPFRIGIAERDEWLACMAQAMQEARADFEMMVSEAENVLAPDQRERLAAIGRERAEAETLTGGLSALLTARARQIIGDAAGASQRLAVTRIEVAGHRPDPAPEKIGRAHV